jgi:hypothetical protein
MLKLEHQGKDFVLPHELLAKFCRVVEFTNKKNDYIYLCSDGELFTIFSQSTLASVMTSASLPTGKKFWLGVNSEKFCSLVRKLYEDSHIWLRPRAKSLMVEEDNISVKFSVLDYVKQYSVPQFSVLSGAAVDYLVDSIWKCEAAISTKGQFDKVGVLVDNTSPHVTSVVKFSGASGFRVMNCPKLFEGSRRFVVAPGVAASLHAFCEEIEEVLLSENHIGMKISGDVYAYVPLMVDEYPQNYVSMLGLHDEVQQIDLDRPRYIFDRDTLVNALDLVGTVAGREETQVTWQLAGTSEGSDKPVWRLSAKAVDGCEASEVVSCEEAAPVEGKSFKVHRGNLGNVLRNSADRIALYNFTDRNIAVANIGGTDVTLLPKFG